MNSVSIMHDMSNPVFWEKNKINIWICHLLKKYTECWKLISINAWIKQNSIQEMWNKLELAI